MIAKIHNITLLLLDFRARLGRVGRARMKAAIVIAGLIAAALQGLAPALASQNPPDGAEIGAYFPELARGGEISPAHVLRLSRDLESVLSGMEKTGLLANRELALHYWMRHQSEYLTRAQLTGPERDLPLAGLAAKVLVDAIAARWRAQQDRAARERGILRDLNALMNTPAIRLTYSYGAYIAGAVAAWTGHLALQAFASGPGAKLANRTLSGITDPLVQGLGARAKGSRLMQGAAKTSQRLFGISQEKAANRRLGPQDAANLATLARDLSDLTGGRQINEQEAGRLWDRIIDGQLKEMSIQWEAGLEDYLKNAREQWIAAAVTKPLQFSQAITTQLTSYELHRQGLRELELQLSATGPGLPGIPLHTIETALEVDEKLHVAMKEGAPVQELQRELERLRGDLSRSGSGAILESFGGGLESRSGPEARARIGRMETDINQLFVHKEFMRNARDTTGALLGAWFDNDIRFSEQHWKLPSELREVLRKMKTAMGHDFYLAIAKAAPGMDGAIQQMRKTARDLGWDPARLRAQEGPDPEKADLGVGAHPPKCDLATLVSSVGKP